MFVYVGTYTVRGSKGIYQYRMDASSGALELVSSSSGLENPTFLAIEPRRRYLYAVSEMLDDRPEGAVSAFSIAPETGGLTYLNQQSTRGTGPCHVTVDKTGKFALGVNYSGGSVFVLPIRQDGSLGQATDFIQHEGSSVNAERQEGPHAHSVTLDATNCYAFAADLGLDKIIIYKFDSVEGKLAPNQQPWARVRAGAGPRHFAFHPNGRHAYVINELDSTLTAFAYDQMKGTLTEAETVSTLPGDFHGTKSCADVHVSPSGRFLYGSNRGHDSIVVFAIDDETGRLTYVDHEPSGGETPRNFVIDPTGTLLLAANQDTDSIVTFRIDQETGKLNPTGHVVEVPAPVCLKLIPSH